jgi:uncharacterized repeat protein (TIGR03803 family)
MPSALIDLTLRQISIFTRYADGVHKQWSLGSLAILLAFAAVAAQAQTLTTLYSFTSGADGKPAYSGLVRDAAGNLYGTAQYGGIKRCPLGCGTIFKLDATGKETLLHSFTGGADGSNPIAGLIRDSAGNLYGATSLGGHFKVGTVFKLDSAGTFTVLYSFTGAPDGAQPHSSLLRDEQGNLYGTTVSGGDLTCNPSGGCGTVFKVDSTRKETVLHTFTGGADGKFPQAALIRDAAGNLFGTTTSGGGAGGGTCGNSGCGTVFEVDNTAKETVLHSFSGGEDGQTVFAGLVVDGQSFYGATGGGSPPAFGTLFKVDKTGIETVLYTFTGGADGGFPFASLIHDAAGNFYGTTGSGGAFGLGTVFKLDTTGKETVLYSFTGGADGGTPNGSLVRDTVGNLYGTTQLGGAFNLGTVFKIAP